MRRLRDECREELGGGGCSLMVFGDGALRTRLMVIAGEPSAEDERKVRLLSGHTGTIMEKMLRAHGGLAGVYTCALWKWKGADGGFEARRAPPRSKAGQAFAAALAEHGRWLERQIETVRPRLLLALGEQPTRYLVSRYGDEAARAEVAAGRRGQLIESVNAHPLNINMRGFQCVLVPTAEPAKALRCRVDHQAIEAACLALARHNTAGVVTMDRFLQPVARPAPADPSVAREDALLAAARAVSRVSGSRGDEEDETETTPPPPPPGAGCKSTPRCAEKRRRPPGAGAGAGEPTAKRMCIGPGE